MGPAWGLVPSLRDLFTFLVSTRHCRAGLSHAAPSGLGGGEWGLHGDSCRPYGTCSPFWFLPGTAVPGFPMPPLRGWVAVNGACMGTRAVPTGLVHLSGFYPALPCRAFPCRPFGAGVEGSLMCRGRCAAGH